LLESPIKPLVDANGNLYVLDNGIPGGPSSFDPTILVYGPQTATGSISPPPLRQISHLGAIGATSGCTDMEFDPTGQFLFVACFNQIDVFPISANNTASSQVTAEIQDTSLSIEAALAFDPSGNLYISDDSLNEIDIVAAPIATTGGPHSVSGSHSIAAANGAWPASLSTISMFIDENGALYSPFFYLSSGSGPPDAMAELAIWPGTSLPCTSCAPGATLTGTPFTTHAVAEITLDPEGEAYVVNNTTNVISIFSRASVSGSSAINVAPARTIINTAQGAVGPLGMTVGP
jgi:DNA-binding beta-propeller fold protein YncE